MARKLRIQYPGAIYHVMSRGDRREAIFRDDADRRCLLQTLSETCDKTGWQVHAYCLMGTHFHLVLETPQPNLVEGMKWLLGTYTGRFNRRHRQFGHLFSGRYKALMVDGSGNGYLRTVCEYVHLNPVRAKLVAPEQAWWISEGTGIGREASATATCQIGGCGSKRLMTKKNRAGGSRDRTECRPAAFGSRLRLRKLKLASLCECKAILGRDGKPAGAPLASLADQRGDAIAGDQR